MPKTIKHTLADGTEIEIPLPDNYVTMDEIKKTFVPKATFDVELGRRANSIADEKVKGERERLLNEDEEFKKAAFDKWGVSDQQKATAKSIAEAQERARREVETKQVTPLAAQLEAERKKNAQLLEAQRNGKIVQAAVDAGISKALLKEAGGKPIIANMLGDQFGYDEKTGEFFVKSGDTFAYSNTPTAERPFMSIGEFMKNWALDKANEQFVEDTRQRGPSMGRPGNVGSQGNVQISRTDAKNIRLLMAARDKADKMGVSVVVVDG